MDISNQNLDTTEITIRNNSKINAKNLWKYDDNCEYQIHATIFSTDSTTESDETISSFKKVNIMDLEKRKEVYGVCGECNEPGTGYLWCQPCNAKRFKDNFKNWTSGNKNIDELIQQSQLNTFFASKCLEWIPFEKFENVTYLTRGGFSKIYSADWPEGSIWNWDIENQEWERISRKVALKSLNNSSNNISNDFLDEIKYYISGHFHATNTVMCFGITQDPDTKDYMMVLDYYEGGNLRNTLVKGLDYKTKISCLFCIIDGLSGIHDAGNIHKDFHSGNILHDNNYDILSISDLGMCQPVNNEEQSVKKGIYGVLSYMAPEVLHGYQYTKAADIYSFGIIMNEFMSEEITYNDISHDNNLAVNICKGFRPKISEDTPKLIADLIIKCWDAKAENRPTAKELRQIIFKYDKEKEDENSEISYQIKESIYTSRLLNFENLPEPVNSTDYLSSFQETISPSSANPISECLDCELNELDLNQDDDE
ncbi:kinase-like domain-containing protein [Rhizophagus irregularis DAOM 181602=DAOM 197198]|uniref:Kinase-like domain-containing protein n=1 Tax=Rhizophagus irregularis (strain DAOM 181602 / DAOM 197198 / MUCL 43194) TaxID=747089 RepID=A0A2P4Q886_RHIID|nr:kinase-like domain-containing protein [Rhizophagus irregularis DAOM 181602=DAOM 197198]POG73847.1 kinase-like domain-containing protein [Rhizophagus irregularis DAOM 181602=DAOM 197198]|eukprot:XP_025180713.1 kinase-like domain-containing protein [Rhizophagus irregularis DAOM 181602=DAOM 197198]